MTRLYPDVFVLAERGFAGGHVAFLEGFYSSPSDQELTLARIRRESVPFVLVLEDQEDTFRRGFERVADHVRTHYAPMADIAVEETARLSVFVENDRRSTTTDAATGWPCFT
jgi:hypothetical protein